MSGNEDSAGEPSPSIGIRGIMKGKSGPAADVLTDFQLTPFAAPGRAKPQLQVLEEEVARLKNQLAQKDTEFQNELDKQEKEKKSAARKAREEGEAEGRRKGEAEAFARYQKELDSLRKNARGVLDALSAEKDALFLDFEGQAMTLVTQCVRKVFDDIAENEARAVLPLLKRSIQALSRLNKVRVRVNPKDFATADETRDFWLPLNRDRAGIQLEADEHIAVASCIVEAPEEHVALHLDEIMRDLEQAIRQVWENKKAALELSKSESEDHASQQQDVSGSQGDGGQALGSSAGTEDGAEGEKTADGLGTPEEDEQ